MDQKTTKIIFFGTPEFAVPSFEALIKELRFNVQAVVTNPDEPVGRKRVLTPPPVKIIAQKHNIPVLQPELLRSNSKFIEEFKKLNPDICVVAAYGKIIPKEYLEIPHLGFINIHPSLLPKYRGPTPIQSAILNGEKATGITIMMVDEEVDHGPILSTISYKLKAISYYSEILKELSILGADLLIKTLLNYIAGKIKPKEQNHKQATFTRKFTRDDGKIDWNKSAKDIFNQIRALNPEPGTWTSWDNKLIKIHQANIVSEKESKDRPGTVRIINKELLVKTNSEWLKIEKIQIESKKAVSPQEFIRGYPPINGVVLN